MLRLSFRSTLLVSFLLIAGALAAAAVTGWLGLEATARAIQDGKREALALSAAARRIGERTVDLERSARQYLVLGDQTLATRFAGTVEDARAALAVLESAGTDFSAPSADWRATAERIGARLEAAHAAAHDDVGTPTTPTVLAADEADGDFARLAALSATLATLVEDRLARRDRAVMDALDRERHTVAVQVLGALLLAAALAALGGWWLLRPLGRIEHAIAALGEGRLAQAIQITGPADLRQLGERLDWLRLRLAELEANRNRVLRHVSHELKTPLASLHEGVALLADGVLGRLTPEQREVAGILEHSARTLQERIEQLLQYNASQFDARTLDLQPTALLPLLREVAAELRLQARARGVGIDFAGAAPIVSADIAKLRTAFSNLLANAVAFSPADGRIEIEIGVDGERVVIDCRDQGPGIEPAELERIFEPFFQGSRSSGAPVKGSGIGLAIVHEFISAHHGTVRALPSAHGAHFRIELPHA
ncbi:Sensor histidine kinase GlrK [Thauera sp. GDN1]|uniref:sensor histidine kinase n=1 Tax=Thauera sp. GDN1 TaxID=2944810 RepID=UPI00247A69BB|nr:HAMP domain-containing sensor histidine kinase [Thauera sp. GDN1]WEN43296.1 Sensor histidine kinase GlrK [Thauera sp. GDN1]